nr:hypothetical protein [Tanacetum cinerariifolium]
MRKGEKFVWNEEREKSFEELKQHLVSSSEEFHEISSSESSDGTSGTPGLEP